jgi:hypothetical protein
MTSAKSYLQPFLMYLSCEDESGCELVVLGQACWGRVVHRRHLVQGVAGVDHMLAGKVIFLDLEIGLWRRLLVRAGVDLMNQFRP